MAARCTQHRKPRRETGTARLLGQRRLREPGLGEDLPELFGPSAFRERRARALALRREHVVGGLLDQARRLVAHGPLT